MGISAKTRAWLWATAVFSAVLAVASATPIWSVWYFNEWEGLGYRGTLWNAFVQFRKNFETVDPHRSLVELYYVDLVQAASLVIVAGFFRIASYRILVKSL
jgi:hypothetical protein